MNNKLKQAFTLIELLVVIAIIGILSGLIITTMSGATESARIAKLKVYSNSIRDTLGANLVSEWKFDEGSLIAANDTWGTSVGTLKENGGATCSFTSTLHCPQWQASTNCVSGQCLSFDGVDDYVDVLDSTSLNPTNEITISAWIRRTGKLNDTNIIVSKDDVGIKRQYALYFSSGNCLHFIVFKSGVSYTAIQSVSTYTSLNTWYYVVGTYKYIADGTSVLDLYVDGNKNAAQITNAVGPIAITDQHLMIGDDGYVPLNRTFQGSIDDVRIYNAAISTTQIQENYLAGLNKLLANNGITKTEYNQRMVELNNSVAEK